MKPKLSIPSRNRTPEDQARYDDLMMINELYVRWVNKIYKQGDEFLIIKHIDRLEDIKAQAEWRERQQTYKMEWQSEQFNKTTKDD
jgi:hypothetical protein